MSIIIRLQNLPWDASALNIRQFFFGLSIPDGGVHIIGGEKGDAFIAFSTDEDARQAMRNDGGYIGSTPVKLFLSSKTEMQNVIAAARETSTASAQGGPSADLGPSQRMRFISPSHSSGHPTSFNQPTYGSSGNAPRMGFSQQNQQHPVQSPQQFNRPPNDFRSQNTEFRPLTTSSPEFRPLLPNPSSSRFPTFDHRSPLTETRVPRINFDPQQAFHEQKPQSYWGGGQSEMPKESSSSQLYEPFGGNSEKKGFAYKSGEGKPPAEVFSGREDWNGRGRNSPRDFPMDSRRDVNYQTNGSEFSRRDFDVTMRGPFNRLDVEDEHRRSRMPDRFGPIGDQAMDRPMGFDREFGDIDQWRKFGPERYSQKRDFIPDFHMDRGRSDYHDFHGFCVFVRDLPSYFGPRDVRAVFRNCDIPSSRLNIVHDRNGKKIGHAYIRLSCAEELDEALRENGRMIENRRIRVTRCHEKDFEEAGMVEARPRSRHRSRSPRPESEGYHIVIKNLPGASFVRKCVADVKIAHNGGPFMELGKNGKESGVALVELERRRDLEEMLTRHKMAFGGHLANIYKIPREEFKQRIKGSKPLSGEVDNSKYTCIEVDGISWGCTEEKVRSFFSGSEIITLHIFLDNAGKASGLAFLEFATTSDCVKAMEKHKQYLDNRYLVLRLISQNEMAASLERHYRNGGRFLNDSYKARQPEGIPYEETVVYMKNLNNRTRLEDILEFFQGYKIIKDSIQLQYKDDRPTGDGMVKFIGRREADDAVLQLNGKVMLGKVVELLF